MEWVDKQFDLGVAPESKAGEKLQIALLLIPLSFAFIPSFTKNQKEKILQLYSYTMLVYVLFFLIRAFIRFLIAKDTSVFFYHGPDNDTDTGLVPRLLNAIHFSVYVSIAFFYFFIKEHKTKIEQIISVFLFVFVILLSSTFSSLYFQFILFFNFSSPI